MFSEYNQERLCCHDFSFLTSQPVDFRQSYLERNIDDLTVLGKENSEKSLPSVGHWNHIELLFGNPFHET